MMVQSAETHPLVGTWKLVSFQVETEGSNELQSWWDEHPVGFVIFTKEGRLLALLTAGDRIASATADQLIGSMCAYSGRYRVEGNRLRTWLIADGFPLGWAKNSLAPSNEMAMICHSCQISKTIQGILGDVLAAY